MKLYMKTEDKVLCAKIENLRIYGTNYTIILKDITNEIVLLFNDMYNDNVPYMWKHYTGYIESKIHDNLYKYELLNNISLVRYTTTIYCAMYGIYYTPKSEDMKSVIQ